MFVSVFLCGTSSDLGQVEGRQVVPDPSQRQDQPILQDPHLGTDFQASSSW